LNARADRGDSSLTLTVERTTSGGSRIAGSSLVVDVDGNLFYKGIPIIRDRNGTRGRLAMLNTNYVRMKYLPHVNPNDALGHAESKLAGSSGNAITMATDIPARIVLLAKTGDNVKASVKTTIQLCVKRPNACGYIADISEM
jgi:hypothetical protein